MYRVVCVGIPLDAAVEVVGVGVLVGVGVTPIVEAGVLVGVGVTDTALVVGVIVGVIEIVGVGVLVGVILIVGVIVIVGVGVLVGVGVTTTALVVGVIVGVTVLVGVGVGKLGTLGVVWGIIPLNANPSRSDPVVK